MKIKWAFYSVVCGNPNTIKIADDETPNAKLSLNLDHLGVLRHEVFVNNVKISPKVPSLDIEFINE